MVGVVNIRRDVDDKFYRYRMPELLTKIEGKGNGIKTVIPNMSDVARALSRPPSYPTKFFGCELGAQTTLDEKKDRYIVNGAHQADRLRELLFGFIDKFVLCGACRNPETDLIIVKNKETRSEDIIRECKACGASTAVDMRHKLTPYIVKNPPTTNKKGKKGEGASSNGAHAVATNPNLPDAEGSEGDDDPSAAAESLPVESSLANEGWSVDTSEDAVKARVKDLSTKLQTTLIADEDSDEDANSPYSQLGQWAEANRDEVNAVEVYKHAQEMGIEKKHKTVQVLAQALFTKNMPSEISKFAPLFAKMNAQSEKHQKAFLGGLERLIGVMHPELVPSVPKILMQFYQADALEEEVIKQWGTHVSKKYVDKETSKMVRKASEPFLKWLDEADDDDSEDEE
ncbi:hypothetical protein SCHPADRAFT_910418 [Schizopora paradoxa]|uniref:W2 domain-containing protein n=1 Tax=Schizopora paradoxa TaxID=27342 RepID=A0A0H2R3F1_9AGAM|nr:hypothetical protein SCHPADRAFT_910418 [Schizopora paradoxa]